MLFLRRGTSRTLPLALLTTALIAAGGRAQAPAPPTQSGPPVVTFHGDNARLGWNRQETILTPQTVTPQTFGKKWHQPLDGSVNGSPLYVPRLDVGGQTRDVVFAATDANSVYALDAATGAILWTAPKLAPQLTAAQFNGSWNSQERHGILSTPVIDPAQGAIYVCAPRARGLSQEYVVWALDLATGKVRDGWPVAINAQYKKTRFKAGQVMQRGALLIHDGWVYIPFGGRGDIPPWRGWIVGINTRTPRAKQQAFCTSPVSDGAGVWSAGGVSATPDGQLFAVTGNGDFDLPRGGENLAQSVVRLRAGNAGLRFAAIPADYYTPANYKFLDEQDEDMGGATALVLPPLPGAKAANLLFTGGKDGCAYLLNRDRLGGLGAEIQRTRLFGSETATYHEGIRATSAYFDAGENGRLLFVSGDQPGTDDNHGLVCLRLDTDGNGTPRFSKVWTLNQDLTRPTSPIVTSDGSKSGIVWLVEPPGEDDDSKESSTLHAYDALTGRELYHSKRDADALFGGRKFTSVTASGGQVFVGARGVYCYGLKPGTIQKEAQ